MTKLIIGILLVAYSAVLTGCNSVKGVGKDMENAGENIQKAAN